METHYGEDHYEVAPALMNLAHAHWPLASRRTSSDMLQRALRILETHYSEDHYRRAIALVNLANASDTWAAGAPLLLSTTVSPSRLDCPRSRLSRYRRQRHQAQTDMLQRALWVMEAHYGEDHY